MMSRRYKPSGGPEPGTANCFGGLVVDRNRLAPGEISLPDWQRDLIRGRLAALEEIPSEDRSVPWEAVRKRLSADKT